MTVAELPVLLAPCDQGLARASEHWWLTRDGDAIAVALFRRHYSCRVPASRFVPGNTARIGGPGQRITLLSGGGDALFVWRRELWRMDGQVGVGCAVFRNEGAVRSSDLIREADSIAWHRCGVTSCRRLTILERLPE